MDKPETGTRRKSSKAQAILLAVLFGPWTWLYTYHQDKRKFWVSLILIPVAFIVIAVTISLTSSAPGFLDAGIFALFLLIIFLVLHEVFSGIISFVFVSLAILTAGGPGVDLHPIYVFLFPICVFLLLAAVWAWAIIDSSIKPKTSYESESTEISKDKALVMAAVFGYNAWLYTYHKDKWKFWVSFGALNLVVPLTWLILQSCTTNLESSGIKEYISGTGALIITVGTITLVGVAILLTIWVLAIIDNLPRSKKWKNFETPAPQEEAPY